MRPNERLRCGVDKDFITKATEVREGRQEDIGRCAHCDECGNGWVQCFIFFVAFADLCGLCVEIFLPAGRNVPRKACVINPASTRATDTRRMGEDLTSQIIGLAIKVHRKLGPGLLEAIYEECLCWELAHAGLAFQRQVPLAVIYEDLHLSPAYYADIIVERSTLLELKSVQHLLPVHQSQTLTYLRLSNCQVALLMNFNSVMLKDGLRRFVPSPP